MDLCPATFRSFVVQWEVKIAGCQPQMKPLKQGVNSCFKPLISCFYNCCFRKKIRTKIKGKINLKTKYNTT